MSNTRKATNPDPMPKPEAPTDEAETVSVEFAGETYTWPVDRMDDLDLLQLFATGRVIDATRWLLGEDDWARFRASVASEDGRVPMSRTKEFVEAVAEPLGNFAASLRS